MQEQAKSETIDLETILQTPIPGLAEALESVCSALERAGIKVPPGELRIEVGHALHDGDATPRKCIVVCLPIYSSDGRRLLGWFCYFDCRRVITDPRNVELTCQYAGKTYSEGAVINEGGVKQKCVKGPYSTTEGIWQTAE